MDLNKISDKPGATKSRKRVGRGIGSGTGKTGGRGVKGQKSRSGVAINGFEGGQMPIYRRLPKRGFSNAMFAKDYNEVSIARLEAAVASGKLDAKKTVDAAALVEAGVIRRERDGVRVLGGSEAKSKFTLSVAGASKGAVEVIEKAGGSVTVLAAAKEEKADA
ncbi:MAG: 50S ribosomal protein L15 [Pseudomonadota bacterium]